MTDFRALVSLVAKGAVEFIIVGVRLPATFCLLLIQRLSRLRLAKATRIILANLKVSRKFLELKIFHADL